MQGHEMIGSAGNGTGDASKNRFLAVMGTLGSGKTTAARLLSRELGFALMEENVEENAFLPRFYKDMHRWAFHSQLFFLMEKIRQMVHAKRLMADSPVIQDTPITQDVYTYAKAQHELGHMDDSEWALYHKIFREFSPMCPEPDLVIFLDTSLESIGKRITERGRSYEQDIPEEYIKLLDALNRRWIEQNPDRVLVIQTDELDISRDRDAQQRFVGLVRSALEHHRGLTVRDSAPAPDL